MKIVGPIESSGDATRPALGDGDGGGGGGAVVSSGIRHGHGHGIHGLLLLLLVGCFGEAKMAGRMNSDNIAIQTKMAGRGECVANHSLFCFDHEMRAVGSGY